MADSKKSEALRQTSDDPGETPGVASEASALEKEEIHEQTSGEVPSEAPSERPSEAGEGIFSDTPSGVPSEPGPDATEGDNDEDAIGADPNEPAGDIRKKHKDEEAQPKEPDVGPGPPTLRIQTGGESEGEQPSPPLSESQEAAEAEASERPTAKPKEGPEDVAPKTRLAKKAEAPKKPPQIQKKKSYLKQTSSPPHEPERPSSESPKIVVPSKPARAAPAAPAEPSTLPSLDLVNQIRAAIAELGGISELIKEHNSFLKAAKERRAKLDGLCNRLKALSGDPSGMLKQHVQEPHAVSKTWRRTSLIAEDAEGSRLGLRPSSRQPSRRPLSRAKPLPLLKAKTPTPPKRADQ